MTNWQYGIVMAIALICFGYGYYLGNPHADSHMRRLEQRNNELNAGIDYWVEQYKQAAAIARGAFVAVGDAPAGTGDE